MHFEKFCSTFAKGGGLTETWKRNKNDLIASHTTAILNVSGNRIHSTLQFTNYNYVIFNTETHALYLFFT